MWSKVLFNWKLFGNIRGEKEVCVLERIQTSLEWKYAKKYRDKQMEKQAHDNTFLL